MARVVIGIPCYDMVAPEVLEDFSRFLYHCGRRLPQHDFFLAIKRKSEQFRARNAIVDAAQQVNADYLLMMDDDMIVNPANTAGPSNAYDLVEKLIAANKDIVGGLYFGRQGGCPPVLMTKVGDSSGYRFLRSEEIERRLQPVDVVGGGCMLINMRIFDFLKPPYFEPEFSLGTDIQICKKAAEAGFSVWADTSIELGHVRQERIVVTSANRHQFLNDQLPGETRTNLVLSDVYDRLLQDGIEFTGLPDIDALREAGNSFLSHREEFDGTNQEWYRKYSMQRVARQIAFNMLNANKRAMTEYIIGAVNGSGKREVLDFGCGIGIPAFTLAENGHTVTACDVKGTGTLSFLRWRAQKRNVELTFHESETEAPPLGDAKFDVIIAMDVLEHLKSWQWVLRGLYDHLKPGGVLFCNNGILDDKTHPEHYDLEPKDFIAEVAKLGLVPFNEIGFHKPVPK